MAEEIRHLTGIAFLVGKPLHSKSILAEVVERLHHDVPTIALHRMSGGDAIPNSIAHSSLIVQRGLDLDALDQLSMLEAAGVRFCNRISATTVCHDRAAISAMLSANGVPVPESMRVEHWAELVQAVGSRSIVVKMNDGEVGRGAHVLIAPDGDLPVTPPFQGSYLVQAYVPHTSEVYKLYITGRRVRGLIKAHQRVPGQTEPGIPFEVDPELKRLARRVGDVAGLEIFGMDVLRGPDGFSVIDVNAFPGFRGVPDAPRLIASYVQAVTMDDEIRSM